MKFSLVVVGGAAAERLMRTHSVNQAGSYVDVKGQKAPACPAGQVYFGSVCSADCGTSEWCAEWHIPDGARTCKDKGVRCAKCHPHAEKFCNMGPINLMMYRAQSESQYYVENQDMASAGGVLKYLHTEIVKLPCPRNPPFIRHYNITRIIRYNVTVWNTYENYKLRHGRMGPFKAFDYGKCTVGGCQETYKKYGSVVGCQNQPFLERSGYGGDAIWYSLPGKCSSHNVTELLNDPKCECPPGEPCDEPGGMCEDPNGSGACTWSAVPAGDISLEELTGEADYETFCKWGGVEYNEFTGRGWHTSFWNTNGLRPFYFQNRWRVNRLMWTFKNKYNEDHWDPNSFHCDGW
mmetsp:Transcript_31901/g.73134  ORF Transcript_31901/g.73134 Transcript_31901/m.73134 type:complete len:349 (+) Transcript_31901:108-1154(+)